MRWPQMLTPHREGREPAVTDDDRMALAEMRQRSRELLDRADRAIRAGMDDAGRGQGRRGAG